MREIIRIRVEHAGVQVVGEAGHGIEALRIITELKPDIAIVDLQMAGMDGLEIVKRVAELGVPTRTMLYTADARPLQVQRALDAGAKGFLNKSAPHDMLAHAMETIIGGGCFVDPEMAALLLLPAKVMLSPRELEVLALITEGKQNKEIAIELAVSVETVKAHVSSVMVKLEVHSRTGAVAVALREQLVI
jgi:DNA-binding NarL/FixJ family response regulator